MSETVSGAKATRVAPANVNHNLAVLLAELPHLLPDRRALKLDRGELRLLGKVSANGHVRALRMSLKPILGQIDHDAVDGDAGLRSGLAG